MARISGPFYSVMKLVSTYRCQQIAGISQERAD